MLLLKQYVFPYASRDHNAMSSFWLRDESRSFPSTACGKSR